ncbi:HIT domain-containing protein [Candidatus Roizmanbacteria bacterium]|nr:MAG: HIT domain-containing protein [Candidatus Roizmanbacteria bacterium]
MMGTYMEDCIFCKIVQGEIPSYKVYEDESYLAFMDVFPRVKGHVLVIPKEHYRWVYDVPDFAGYWQTAKKIGMKIQQAVGSDYISFITMGEAVPHAHIHILPQHHGEIHGIKFTPVVEMTKEEIGTLAKEIADNY